MPFAIGKDTFPTIWIYICILFNLVGIASLLMTMIAEMVIIVQNYTAYVDFYGYNYRMSRSNLFRCYT